MAAASPVIKIGFLEVLRQIQSQYGLIVLVLVLLLVFAGLLLWKLVWKVWSTAMESKEKEIERVSKERDKYQALVFERLRSSEAGRSKAVERSGDN